MPTGVYIRTQFHRDRLKGKRGKLPQMARVNGEKHLGKYSEKGFYKKRNTGGLHIRKKGEWKPNQETIKRMSDSKKGKQSKLKGIPQPDKRGENANNWKGGKVSEYSRVRAKIEWKIWREKVFIRDDFTCQKCGLGGVELHPHHLIQVKDLIGNNENMIYEVNNGMTLCKKCHKEVHRKRGY